jgi:hypothetical protein
VGSVGLTVCSPPGLRHGSLLVVVACLPHGTSDNVGVGFTDGDSDGDHGQ